MITKFGSSTNGLGDLLLLTSICKFFPNKFTIQIPKNKEKYSILFWGLAEVEITDDINILPDIGNGHYATRKLRNFFSNPLVLDNRPLVLYSDLESEEWANNFLQDKKNPIILTPNCSKQWASIRNMPKKLALDFLNSSEEAILMINSENEFESNHKIKLIDLDLKKTICLFRKVGFYVGCNTGDEHLATAVGCRTFVYQPQHPSFNKEEWNYKHRNNTYYNFQI